MNRLFILLLLGAASVGAHAQQPNIQGKWKGTIVICTTDVKQQQPIEVQFRQSGRAVWGIYSRGADTAGKGADCAGRLIARMPAKQSDYISIYNDGVETNAIELPFCQYINVLDATYITQDGKEYLTGIFHSSAGFQYNPPAGTFLLEKIAVTGTKDVDSHFPKLAKLISNFNAAQ